MRHSITTMFLLLLLAGRSAVAQEAPTPTLDPPHQAVDMVDIDAQSDEPIVTQAPATVENPAATPPGMAVAPGVTSARRTNTGDLLDRLYSTRESGITFGGRVTNFGFGIAGGINRPVPPPLGRGDVFTYTGRGEYDLIFDLEKFGGPPKGRLLVRAENWYGQYGNVSLRAGTFAPPVFPALIPVRPNNPGVPYITNFLWTQPLSKNWVVFAGKKDVLGTFDQDKFAGGDGTDQFINQAFVANPSFLLGLPYTSFTAGFVSPRKWGGFSAFVLDPKDRTADFMQFGDLFAKGIIVGGEVKAKTMFFDLPGEQHVGGIWKHHPLTDLRIGESTPGVYPELALPRLPTINDSFTLYYGFDQYLVRFIEESDRGWGLFGRASISDGNPTPVQYFLEAGIGGFSPFGQQRGDRFGMGWYLAGASNQFGPIPQAIFGNRNGTGVECFYNFQATPWLNISPSIQWLRPGAGAIAENNAFVYGLRVNVTF